MLWVTLRVPAPMIDNFSLGLTHLLMLFAAWRLLRRPDLDDERVRDDSPRKGRDRFGA
jgi:hypothetical protein